MAENGREKLKPISIFYFLSGVKKRNETKRINGIFSETKRNEFFLRK
jgi:hypothetical protein